jgi:hypothetical protein
MNIDVEKLISKLNGSVLTDIILVGDGGHFDFSRLPLAGSRTMQESPFCTIYARCRIKLSSKSGTISPNTLSESVSGRSSHAACLKDQCVERAGLDSENNALHILFVNGILLSIFPSEEDSDVGAWVFYSTLLLENNYIVFWKDKHEILIA